MPYLVVCPLNSPGGGSLPYVFPLAENAMEHLKELMHANFKSPDWYSIWVSVACLKCQCGDKKDPNGKTFSTREWTQQAPKWIKMDMEATERVHSAATDPLGAQALTQVLREETSKMAAKECPRGRK